VRPKIVFVLNYFCGILFSKNSLVVKTDATPPFIVFVLLALALIFHGLAQISGFRQTSKNLEPEIARAEKEIASIREIHEKRSKEIEKRKILVTQAEQEMKRFTNVIKELDELARHGDKDALNILGPNWELTPRDPNDHRLRI